MCQLQVLCAFSFLQAFFYQLKLEAELDEPPATQLNQVSLADVMM